MSSQTLTQRLFDDEILLKPDPFEIFSAWLDEAKEKEINDPIAMSLATVDSDGLPDCRMVLMNQFDSRGCVFFTNSNSAKGQQLETNPVAAVLFHWKSCRRQVRMRGQIEVVSSAEANDYFASRRRGSQVGAHASNQSHPLRTRDELLTSWQAIDKQLEGQTVKRPEHWNGYRILAQQIEFWENGEFRLHNRIRYLRDANDWKTDRLHP